MKKLLIILLSVLSFAASAQIDQKFSAFAPSLDSLYAYPGRQFQPVFVHGRFSPNDGFASIFYYDSTSLLTEVPYTIFKVTGKDTGRWIQTQIVSSGGGDTSIFADADYIVLDILTVPPVSPTTGDIYLAGIGSAGAWITEDNNIQEWNGSAWVNTVPAIGQLLINAANDGIYKFTAGGWVLLSTVLHDPSDNYGNRNLSAGNRRNKAFSLKTNNIIRLRIDSVGRTYIYNTPTGTAGTDSVLVQSGGMVRKISPTYYSTGGGSGLDTTKQFRTDLYGIIKNQASFDTTNWDNNGGTAPAIASGSLEFSGGTNVFTKSFDYDYYTGLHRWKIYDTVIITEKSATSYGNGVGIRSLSRGLKIDNAAWFDASTGANSGKISVYGYLLTTSAMGSITSTAALTFSVNDTIIITCERNLDTLIGTAFNQTTKTAPVSVSYACGSNNTGKFAIFNLGGTFTVAGISIQSAETVKADLMYVGDSKWRTSTTNNYATRAYALLSPYYPSYTVNAGSSDYSSDILAKIAEIIALKPRQVIMLINYNDLANGVPTATWQSNDTAINGQLTRAGIRVYWANTYSSASSGTYTTRIDSFYSAVFPATYIRQTYISTRNYPNTVLGDGVHLSDIGQQVLATAILNSNVITDGNSVNPFTVMSISNPVTLPSNEIGYGTGVGITSNSRLIRDNSNNIAINGSPISVFNVFKSTPKGTIAKTSGGSTLTGTNTQFNQDLKPGDQIYTSDGEYKIINTITGATTATITTTWASTCTACTYIDSSVSAAGDRPLFQVSNNAVIKQGTTNLIVTGSAGTGVGLGQGVMATKGVGFHNTAVGAGALSNSNTNYNSGFGHNAASGITGIQNTALGAQSMESYTSGDENTAVGYNTLNSGVGGFNTVVGSRAMPVNTGVNNTAVGMRSLQVNSTGGNNIALGYFSDFSNKTGSTRTVIGYRAMLGWNLSNVSNYDNTIYITGKNGIDSTVSTTSLVGINTNAPNSTFHINGSLSTAYVAKTGTYTATVLDHTIEATSGTFTITLPTAVGNAGREYFITNSGSGTITLATTSSQTFVNVSGTPTTLSLPQFTTYIITSNGANFLAK